MKLQQYFKILITITVMALGYVHMQMQIFNLAYEGKAKEKAIRALIEENGSLTYSILALKSSSNLGIQLLADNTDMQFANPEDIITLSTSEDLDPVELTSGQTYSKNTSVNTLFNFISFGSKAEAQLNR